MDATTAAASSAIGAGTSNDVLRNAGVCYFICTYTCNTMVTYMHVGDIQVVTGMAPGLA